MERIMETNPNGSPFNVFLSRGFDVELLLFDLAAFC